MIITAMNSPGMDNEEELLRLQEYEKLRYQSLIRERVLLILESLRLETHVHKLKLAVKALNQVSLEDQMGRLISNLGAIQAATLLLEIATAISSGEELSRIRLQYEYNSNVLTAIDQIIEILQP